MQQRHDQLGKRILRGLYEGCGDFTVEEEVSPDAQRFDGYFVPHPDVVARSGDLLYRLGVEPTAFEVTSGAPTTEGMVELLRKVLNARHVFALAKPPRPLPRLWVLCAGHPEAALAALRAEPAPAIAEGVYLLAPALSSGVVVLGQLPETSDTLLLRLLGRERTRARAIAELSALPEGAWQRKIGFKVLVELRYEIEAKPQRTTEDEEFVMQTQSVAEMIYERWRDQGVHEGRDQGLQEGRREGRREGLEGERRMLVGVYRARFGEVPAAIEAAVAAAEEEDLMAWLPVFATRSEAEIAAALHPAAP